MNPQRFDALAKALTAAGSRRGLLRAVAATGLAVIADRFGPRAGASPRAGQPCAGDGDCGWDRCCAGVCVAAFADPAHCGACGHACPHATVCCLGACCAPGLLCDRVGGCVKPGGASATRPITIDLALAAADPVDAQTLDPAHAYLVDTGSHWYFTAEFAGGGTLGALLQNTPSDALVAGFVQTLVRTTTSGAPSTTATGQQTITALNLWTDAKASAAAYATLPASLSFAPKSASLASTDKTALRKAGASRVESIQWAVTAQESGTPFHAFATIFQIGPATGAVVNVNLDSASAKTPSTSALALAVVERLAALIAASEGGPEALLPVFDPTKSVIVGYYTMRDGQVFATNSDTPTTIAAAHARNASVSSEYQHLDYVPVASGLGMLLGFTIRSYPTEATAKADFANVPLWVRQDGAAAGFTAAAAPTGALFSAPREVRAYDSVLTLAGGSGALPGAVTYLRTGNLIMQADTRGAVTVPGGAAIAPGYQAALRAMNDAGLAAALRASGVALPKAPDWRTLAAAAVKLQADCLKKPSACRA